MAKKKVLIGFDLKVYDATKLIEYRIGYKISPDSTCIFLEYKLGLATIFVTFFVTRKLKKALQIPVTPFSAESEGH